MGLDGPYELAQLPYAPRGMREWLSSFLAVSGTVQ